jgi:hypothetical protein
MHYWNVKNFEGLCDLGNEFSSVPYLSGLAEYCSLREKGLRAEAFKVLEKFIREASGRETDVKRRMVIDILIANSRTPEAHQFLTHPILTKLLYPTLEKWLSDSPSALEPLRWLGLMRSEVKNLEAALSIDPSDVPVRRRLVDMELSKVDYATHHLDESVLLAPLEECRSSLFRAKTLIQGACESKPFADLYGELKEYEQMLDDWVLFNESEYKDFPKWCRTNGRDYRWCTKVYYDHK